MTTASTKQITQDAPTMCRKKGRRTFFLEFIKNMKEIGAVAPSSRFLARCIVDPKCVNNASVVVEYGPGTGVFTAQILSQISNKTNFFAIETSSTMVEWLNKKYPQLNLYEDSVENLPQILAQNNLPSVDCIISGLPWAIFDEDLQDRLLEATCKSLSDDGTFSTFTYIHSVYLPAGRRFRKKLDQYFSSVTKSPIVWRNLPPAFVYRCKK